MKDKTNNKYCLCKNKLEDDDDRRFSGLDRRNQRRQATCFSFSQSIDWLIENRLEAKRKPNDWKRESSIVAHISPSEHVCISCSVVIATFRTYWERHFICRAWVSTSSTRLDRIASIAMHKSYQSTLPSSNRLLKKKWDDKYYSEHRILVISSSSDQHRDTSIA